MKIKDIIMLLISILFLAITMPTAFIYISESENFIVNISGTSYTMAGSVDPLVLIFWSVMLPIILIVVIIMAYVKYIR